MRVRESRGVRRGACLGGRGGIGAVGSARWTRRGAIGAVGSAPWTRRAGIGAVGKARWASRAFRGAWGDEVALAACRSVRRPRNDVRPADDGKRVVLALRFSHSV
jgi:hypothetical protein